MSAMDPMKARRMNRVARGRRRSQTSQNRLRTVNPKPKRLGPDASANLRRKFERYVELARAAESSGDAVESESNYQHAEHYLRLMNEKIE